MIAVLLVGLAIQADQAEVEDLVIGEVDLMINPNNMDDILQEEIMQRFLKVQNFLSPT